MKGAVDAYDPPLEARVPRLDRCCLKQKVGYSRDETGPCNGVKGAVDAYDPPLEARVPRLDRCCLKQKVGYSRDTAPKNNPLSKTSGETAHATQSR